MMPYENFIDEQGVRNHPLNDLQKGFNRLKSQVRCMIGHIFGCGENSQAYGLSRTIWPRKGRIEVI